MSKKTEQDAAEAGWLRVLTDYLLCFHPAEAPGPGVEIKSTDEIINDLATMEAMANMVGSCSEFPSRSFFLR